MKLAAAHWPDLALVDVWMPSPSGMELVDRLKTLDPDLEAIIITAYGSIGAAVEAMHGGAFYYLTKPFSLRQVSEIVNRALVARDARIQARECDLEIDLTRQSVIRRGQPVRLSELEFELLACLVQQRGRLMTYQALLEQVWGYPPGACDLALVRNAVKRLRQKLGDEATDPGYIVNVRGQGYRWVGTVNLIQKWGQFVVEY